MTRDLWKTPMYGRCSVCGKKGRLVRHHVLQRQYVRREGGDEWAVSNSMLLGARCDCHAQHHSGFRRISIDLVPGSAIDFATRLLGPDRAAMYFSRYYGEPLAEDGVA